MDILLNGCVYGELVTEEKGLYVLYKAVCRPSRGLVRLFAVGERGELKLGVMQPENGCQTLCRSLSRRESADAGRLLRGELRPLVRRESGWHPVSGTEMPFCRADLQASVREIDGCMVYYDEERCFWAAPFGTTEPFPLTELFCFARVRWIGKHEYAVFCFDAEGEPVFF